jgi:hypothetical protein
MTNLTAADPCATARRGTYERPKLLGLLVVPALAVMLTGCAVPGAGPSGTGGGVPPEDAATWPVQPELLPTPTASAPGAELSCGGRSFPMGGLDAPAGAESRNGPEYDALRVALGDYAEVFPGLDRLTWRLALDDAQGLLFMARQAPGAGHAWVSLELDRNGSSWTAGPIGECDPAVALPGGYGPASWALDPAYPAPTSSSTELHVLVWELACSGGRPATGRMSVPVVHVSATTVTITLGVRPLRGFQDCPLGPGTPAIIRLPEPLGDRQLLDGGHEPPITPSPALPNVP